MGGKTISEGNDKHKFTKIVALIVDKTDLKTKLITGNQEGLRLKKVLIQQYTIIINVFALSNRIHELHQNT